MSDPEHDPSIHAEPHLRKEPPSPDPREERVARNLDREKTGGDPAEERAKHSVFDEPAVLPHREPVLIDQDWICRNCGYNLRGLPTGHPCPECGVVERYEPPRAGEVTYARWMAEHQGRPRAATAWLIAAGIPLLSIPLAVACAFLVVDFSLHAFVIFGPVVAEVAKVAPALMVIERRVRLIHRPGQIFLMTLGTAVVFAVAQDLVYLFIYFKNSPPELVAWRWTVAPVLHGVCTYLATRGLISVWSSAQEESRLPRVSRAFPGITLAILIHALFNAYIFLKGHSGYGF